MESIWQIISDTYTGYYNYLVNEIMAPGWSNYFYYLIILSLVVWGLELLFPWRKNQKAFRKDFWLDGFYMFFNFFLFAFAISGIYKLIEIGLGSIGLTSSSLAVIPMDALPKVIQLLIFFLLLDFVQWFTHVLLHRVPLFWQFHKVHHSVKEMGFAAHLRYHWMENILYKPLKTLVVMLIGGFEPEMAYIVHFAAIAIGHINHANIYWTYGPLKYIINNPQMHIWHHAKHLPENYRYGVNFGISLSIWDYIFRTDYIPYSGRDIELGYDDDQDMPDSFWGQFVAPFTQIFRKKAH